MTKKEAMDLLKSLGTAQNVKIYKRHGVSGKQFGVSFANLKSLVKQIKKDHALALKLWSTANHDARMLATMIADPEAFDLKALEAWVKDLDNYVISDSFSGMVARTPHAQKLMTRWTKSNQEWIGRAGWQLLAHMSMNDGQLTTGLLEDYLKVIEAGIHKRKNKTRDAMNSALIAIGIRNKTLEKKAVATARRIGKVEVDHGETSCKTPDAVEYIRKTLERKKARQA